MLNSDLFTKLSKFFHKLTHNWIVLKTILIFALKLTLKGSYMFRCETSSSGSTLSDPC
jgi:hypothetical protein